MGIQERRNIARRGAVVRRVVDAVLQNPSVTLSVETLQMWLNIPADAAERIMAHLVASGLLRRVDRRLCVRS